MSLPAVVQTELLGWDLPARLTDLGIGGARVLVAQPLPAGTSVELRVDAPQLWQPLTLPGRVAWSHALTEERAELGLRFEHNSTEALTVLVELVNPSDFE